MDIAVPETSGSDHPISLLSLDRRVTTMEAKYDIDRQDREKFENRIDGKLDNLGRTMQDFVAQSAEKRGTVKGVLLAISFFGSSGGAGLIFLLRHLVLGGS
jgi:hypothetical protein